MLTARVIEPSISHGHHRLYQYTKRMAACACALTIASLMLSQDDRYPMSRRKWAKRTTLDLNIRVPAKLTLPAMGIDQYYTCITNLSISKL